MCGIAVTHTLKDAYSFAKDQQHRGREAVGIAAIGDNRIDVLKWVGTTEAFEVDDLHLIFPGEGHDYHTFLSHIRYATRGQKDSKDILKDAHPHVIGGRQEDRGTHVIINDCDAVVVHNGQVDGKYFNGEIFDLKTNCDTESFLHFYRKYRAKGILEKIPGAYTAVIAEKYRKEILVLRDKTGIKPGVLGWKNGKCVIASEEIAFRKNHARFLENLEPGCVYSITPEGRYFKERIVSPELNYCFFEWNYLAHVDSILNDVSVRRVREVHGERIALEFAELVAKANLITYVPRCPEVAARKCADCIGKKFSPVFYKMKSTRSFIGSTKAERWGSILKNLYLLNSKRDSLRGLNLVVIEDSMIRGNNGKRERDLLYEVGKANVVHHINYTPPVGIIGKDDVPRGCLFGVDMPPDDDSFIARGRTAEEISEIMEMPVHYLSMEGMLSGFEKLGIPRQNLCTFCIGGPHPFEK
ncbi:MAG: hypothetical protein ABII97_02150 [Patescibacteria group bacterium]